MTDNTRLIGWIFGSPEDIPILKELGVEGDIYYDPATRTINCCIVTLEVLEKLKKDYPICKVTFSPMQVELQYKERPSTKASDCQPDPRPGKEIVVDVVLTDIKERAEIGRHKYGMYLETNNGRNALWDAYQEAIDLVMYLRQVILEQGYLSIKL